MASQATHVETNGRSSRGMFGNAAELVHDLISLSELQFKLLMLDLKEGSRGAVVPLGLIVVGVCLALGCFPILLAALALGLAEAGLSLWLAFLLSAVIGAVVASAIGYGGFLMLKKQARIMERSQQEFDRNLRWVKTALTSKPRPTDYRPMK